MCSCYIFNRLFFFWVNRKRWLYLAKVGLVFFFVEKILIPHIHSFLRIAFFQTTIFDSFAKIKEILFSLFKIYSFCKKCLRSPIFMKKIRLKSMRRGDATNRYSNCIRAKISVIKWKVIVIAKKRLIASARQTVLKNRKRDQRYRIFLFFFFG